MGRIRRRRGAMAAGAVALAGLTALGGSAVASASTPAAHKAHTKSHAANGGVATYAELPQSGPNYIFPFAPLAFFSVANTQQFQYLMYRPLYWFGTGAAPTLNLKFSVGQQPVYSNGGKTVTIKLNHYMWSNGEQVTAQDVVFWLNMYRTNPAGYAGYVPGTIPDDIASAVAKSPTELVLNLKGSVNSYWYTYNELSQITPMPMAWDVSSLSQAPGSQLCAKAAFTSVVVKTQTVKGATTYVPVSPAAKSCMAVYNFLSEQSGYNPTNSAKSSDAFAHYTNSKLWTVVDGPWKLKTFNATGNDVFVPNPKYTGPVKPKLSEFVDQYFTTDTAEANSLYAGNTNVGYLPTQDITANAKSPTVAGANNPRLASKYNIALQPEWGVAYGIYNFASTQDHGQAGKLIHQLYLRQAMQSSIDQPLYIQKLLKGYGTPTYGPVPVLPKNPFTTKYEQNNPYPYNAKKAVALLKAHGWKINVGGTDVCQVAAKCGVPKGTPLTLTMSYATGTVWFTDMVTAEEASWAQAGIHVKLLPGSFTEVSGEAVPSNHNWDIANYGLWIFSPDYYPTGEELWQTGAGSNAGSYSNPKADTLIKATDFSQNNSYFAKYENYLAQQLPYLWQPLTVQVGEVSKNLVGATPLNSLYSFTPETWYFKK